MKRLAVINVVGLTQAVLDASTQMRAFAAKGTRAAVVPAFPAVTCTAQSTYLTGLTPTQHGIVGNGWYDRTLSEVQFWKQSNKLVAGAKIWEDLRREIPGFTCAKVFWWHNMYSTADWSLTPRPMYPADGRKIFDIYTHPASIRTDIKQDLGEFPFPSFWGPIAGIKSSQWIAESAKWVERRHQPTLNLIYLPHLDYNLQRLGPNHPDIQQDIAAIDAVVGDLISFFAKQSVEVVLLSEYGISEVNRPIHLNRLFRDKGWIAIREELGLELLDCGASRVFAVADHQVAHIYLNDPALASEVRALVEKQPGVEKILGAQEKLAAGIAHPRAGDLIAVSDARSWFTYYYWLDDRRAPDFARCVDIHRKPGYDPVELFVDPALAFPKLKIAATLLRKKLGFRMLMNVIPLDATLVRGSHGRIPDSAEHPLFITGNAAVRLPDVLPATAVAGQLKAQLGSTAA
ncbi:MAG TPA: nucleotide pyrophosphatase/phosphodiesterase family protein [Verrucomicrobiae bacterium]|nr:nucleotide pyrophosphatase/phosphodiesterase family protein [Verrucomicrobiae bacterium]